MQVSGRVNELLTAISGSVEQVSAVLRALSQGDLNALSPLLLNALEEPAVELVPDIGRVKEALLQAGARTASMTGSGSAVFGIFGSKEEAEAALPALSEYPFAAVCESI